MRGLSPFAAGLLWCPVEVGESGPALADADADGVPALPPEELDPPLPSCEDGVLVGDGLRVGDGWLECCGGATPG